MIDHLLTHDQLLHRRMPISERGLRSESFRVSSSVNKSSRSLSLVLRSWRILVFRTSNDSIESNAAHHFALISTPTSRTKRKSLIFVPALLLRGHAYILHRNAIIDLASYLRTPRFPRPIKAPSKPTASTFCTSLRQEASMESKHFQATCKFILYCCSWSL